MLGTLSEKNTGVLMVSLSSEYPLVWYKPWIVQIVYLGPKYDANSPELSLICRPLNAVNG